MKQVNIRGHLKLKGVRKFIDIDGWLQDNIFYPDKNNARMFYKTTRCHRNWDWGILIEHMEYIDD